LLCTCYTACIINRRQIEIVESGHKCACVITRRMKAGPATMDLGESAVPPAVTSPMMSYVSIGKSTSPCAVEAESCYAAAAAARPTCYYACSLDRDVPVSAPSCCPYSCSGRPAPPPPPPASFAPYATTMTHPSRQNSDDSGPM